jgi:hypothetical protein
VEVDTLLEGVIDILPVFSIFLCSVWIKFDKGEVFKSLFSNYEFNTKQLSENMLLQGLSQLMSVPSTFIFRFI